MNYGNEDASYYGGIPSSIIAYSSDRGRYQSYDGLYDIQSATSQQLLTLQNQLAALQTTVTNIQNSVASQALRVNPNLLANGDCSQFTLNQPVIGTCNAGASNQDFILQGRCIPLMDRWYHVAELVGWSPSKLKMSAYRVKLSTVISGSLAYDKAPRIATYGLSLTYSTTDGSTFFANTSTGMMGIQHLVPDVTLTLGKSYSLGFWLKSSYEGKGFVRFIRQYNRTNTNTGGNLMTSNCLEDLSRQSFDFVVGWNYIEVKCNTNGVLANLTIGNINGLPDSNGLVVQIGPAYMSYNTGITYGKVPTGMTSFEWILTELQLRTDTTASKINFPLNLREYENTREYICSTPNANSVLGIPTSYCKTRTKGSGTYESVIQNFTINFKTRISFPNKMKETPSVIILNEKPYNFAKGISGVYLLGDTAYKTSGSGNAYSWHNWDWGHWAGLTNEYTLTGTYSTTGTNPDYTPTITKTNTGYGAGHRIINISDINFELEHEEAFTFTNWFSFITVDDNRLLANWGTYNTKFVMIVPEAHMGPGAGYSEQLGYIDYQVTACTSRPF